ncbi:hypothetical protein BJ170DRAFT_431192 [Xylariales sp. AK1849]|nr:hypothetical protein BJ170DRAFT_431192 [Xylariales sp. AK1849]
MIVTSASFIRLTSKFRLPAKGPGFKQALCLLSFLRGMGRLRRSKSPQWADGSSSAMRKRRVRRPRLMSRPSTSFFMIVTSAGQTRTIRDLGYLSVASLVKIIVVRLPAIMSTSDRSSHICNEKRIHRQRFVRLSNLPSCSRMLPRLMPCGHFCVLPRAGRGSGRIRERISNPNLGARPQETRRSAEPLLRSPFNGLPSLSSVRHPSPMMQTRPAMRFAPSKTGHEIKDLTCFDHITHSSPDVDVVLFLCANCRRQGISFVV